eukprot:3112843-Prymnesium_polylepis.1
MARVRDARTTRAGSHAEVTHQAGAGTACGSVMQGSVCVLWDYGDKDVCVLRADGTRHADGAR